EDESVSDDLFVSETFEDYSPLKYEPYQDEEEELTIDNQFAWILLWIINFRIRFNIPETATEFLIKFMKLVLTEIGGDKFNRFKYSLFSKEIAWPQRPI
ncbi:11406_t:CDS:1, partial [Funneliformis geosporum]